MNVLPWISSHQAWHCKCTYIIHHDENASPRQLRVLTMFGWHFQTEMLTLSYGKRGCLSQCVTKLWMKKYPIMTLIWYLLGNLLWSVHSTFQHDARKIFTGIQVVQTRQSGHFDRRHALKLTSPSTKTCRYPYTITHLVMITHTPDIYPDSKIHGANMGPICGR